MQGIELGVVRFLVCDSIVVVAADAHNSSSHQHRTAGTARRRGSMRSVVSQARSIVSASRSIKSLPREIELD